MYLFKSKSLERQIKKNDNRLDLLNELNLIMSLLSDANTIEELQKEKRLGFKKFKGTKHELFGIDVGKHLSSTASGERLMVSFIDLNLEEYQPFKDTIDEELTNTKAALLHFYCNHDSQNRIAKELGNNLNTSLEQFINVSAVFTKEEEVELKNTSPINFERFNEPKYNSKTITVLTKDKQDKINNVINNPSATIISGIAGSGKTELIIKLIHRLALNFPNKKILYLSFSDKLVNYVTEKLSVYDHSNVNVWSLRRLLRSINDNKSNYDSFNTFEAFINEYININNSNTNHQLKVKIINFLKKEENLYKVYSDIYGLIFGSMLNDFSRNKNKINIISLDEYNSIIDDYSYFTNEEKKLVYELSVLYKKHLNENNILSYNLECLNLLINTNEKIFDYICIDEIQDLTEVQSCFIFNLVKDKSNLLLAGDIKQIINPTFFKESRMRTYLENHTPVNVYSLPSQNFRNSISIVNLINYINDIRKSKLPSLKDKDSQIEINLNLKQGNLFFLNNDEKDELIDLFDSGDSAIITSDRSTLDNYDNANIYTVQEVKGQEFDHVCIVNLISDYKLEFDNIIKSKSKLKDTALHFIFNIFYVAITRSKYNIVLYEKDSEFLNNILNSIDIDIIKDVNEINLDFDVSALTFYNRGIKLFENGDYKRAIKTFERCQHSEGFNKNLKKKTAQMININNIYLKYNDHEENLAISLEKNEHYYYASFHYGNLNNINKQAIMTLMTGDIEKFETLLKRERVEIFNLYNIKDIYNTKLDEYYNMKINYIKDEVDLLTLSIKETRNIINSVKITKEKENERQRI